MRKLQTFSNSLTILVDSRLAMGHNCCTPTGFDPQPYLGCQRSSQHSLTIMASKVVFWESQLVAPEPYSLPEWIPRIAYICLPPRWPMNGLEQKTPESQPLGRFQEVRHVCHQHGRPNNHVLNHVLTFIKHLQLDNFLLNGFTTEKTNKHGNTTN